MKDSTRVLVTLLNAAAMLGVVVLADPALRMRAGEMLATFAAAAQVRYHRPEPSPGEISAVLAAAETITRGEHG